MDAILPLVKKYGAAVIGLTLDENGIPGTAEERFAIAERILRRAMDYGIPRQDVIIDCLTLTASAQQKEVNETLRAVRMVRDRLGLHTALGVSHVSCGLPLRPVINRTFLTMAMENGLDMPIINPNDEDMMASIFAFNVLKNELQALALDVRMLDGEGNEVSISRTDDDDREVEKASDATLVEDTEGLNVRDSIDEDEAPEAVMGLDEEEV